MTTVCMATVCEINSATKSTLFCQKVALATSKISVAQEAIHVLFGTNHTSSIQIETINQHYLPKSIPLIEEVEEILSYNL